MDKEQLKQLITAARTPEVKAIANYLLTDQGPKVLNREHELVFKGFMMAYYAIIELQDKTITETEED
jgi:hypothetical protein